jgi:nucleoside phosphorylase
MKLLVVAAWPPELVRFQELAAASVDVVGIGVVDAAIGMTRCIARHAPTHVILLGTAGCARGSGLSLGDVVVGRAVHLVDGAVAEGRAAMPQPSADVPLDVPLQEHFAAAGARRSTIANTLAVTTDDALAATLSAIGEVEHLEAYGVARACHASSLPCAVVLGIANFVGSTGRGEWRANHEMASARAAEIAAAGIERWRSAASLY